MGIEPNGIDLTTVQQVADWLATNGQPTPQTADDTDNIQLAITAASAWWIWKLGLQDLGTPMPTTSPLVAPVAYNEWYDGTGTPRMFLKKRPIVSVTSLMIGPLSIPASSGFNSPGFVIDQNKKSLSLRNGGGGYVGGILRVGFWNAPNWNSGYCGAVFTNGVQNINVQYSAGFNGTPDDITLACTQQVAVNIRRRQWIDQKSQAMANGAGTYSYRDWELPPEVMSVVNYYARVAGSSS